MAIFHTPLSIPRSRDWSDRPIYKTRPKAVLSYNFLRSSSHIGGLCSTVASPSRFRSTHFAPNALFASVNSESLMMSKPRVALKCQFNPKSEAAQCAL